MKVHRTITIYQGFNDWTNGTTNLDRTLSDSKPGPGKSEWPEIFYDNWLLDEE